MRLTRIALANVRNYLTAEVEPAPGLNVFIGPNAQGKSNLLEAIAVVTTGKSFRTNRELEIVRDGEKLATMSAHALAAAGEIHLRCSLSIAQRATRKMYSVNGSPVRYASYIGRVRMVCFTPDHLAIVDGPPQGRRALLNSALAQESPAYYAALASYSRVVQQKAALLREQDIDATLLGIYNERLVTAGTRVMLARRHYVAALSERATAVYGRLAERDREEFSVRYAANVLAAESSEDELTAAFTERLRVMADSERIRRACLVGPHRDDLHFHIDGHPLHAYGSQGQRRSAVLALKVAEYRVMRERSGEAPLLLLDDVLSELDTQRQARFLEELGGIEQVFITATAAPPQLVPTRTWHIIAGTLRDEE